MKKICILTQLLHKYGGQQKVVTAITNLLSEKSDYKITVCTLDKNKTYYNLNKNIKVDYKYDLSYRKRNIIQKVFGHCIYKGYLNINNIKILNAIYYPKKRVKKLNQYLMENGFDIVVGVTPELSMLLSLTDYKCKKIGWQHNSYKAYFRLKGVFYYGRESLSRYLFRKLDANIVLNEEDRINFNKYISDNSLVIHNPITIDQKPTTGLNNSTLIFVGRLIKKTKGLDYLVEVLEQLKNINPNYKCFIVGNGPDEDYLHKEIKSRRLDKNTKFVGKTDDVSKYYTKSSILLSTSRFEGLPGVLIEAISCGVIPISFENGGAKEVIENGINGYIIDNFDIKKFVKTINDVLNNEKKRKELSLNAIEKSKEFDVNDILEKWHNILK